MDLQSALFPPDDFKNPLPLAHLNEEENPDRGRCLMFPEALKLEILLTSVEVCRLKRENVPQRCNIHIIYCCLQFACETV